MKPWQPGLALTLLLLAGSCSRPETEPPSSLPPRTEARPLAQNPAFLVKRLSAYQPTSSWESSPTSLVTMGGFTYFAADDAFSGRELWKSDGTTAGTVRVRDIAPGSAWSSPEYLTVVNGTLFFVADDGTYGKELWKSDGTTAGTVMVKDFCPGGGGSSLINYLTVFKGALYFAATDCKAGLALWKTDGTEAGTVMVGNPAGLTVESPRNMVAVGDMLFFTAYGQGWGLWKTDGTAAGTIKLAPFSSIDSPVAFNGALYFTYDDDGIGGRALWKSDGTAAGTVVVKNSCSPCTTFQVSPSLYPVGDTLYFSAWDGTNGFELWKSDGTTDGTVFIKDLVPGSEGSYPSGFVRMGSRLYFFVDNNTSYSLWSTDGTAAGTTSLGWVGSYPSQLTVIGTTLLFRAGDELWKSDGTSAGTAQLKDINPGFSGSNPRALTVLGSTVLFAANDGVDQDELWKSDGTAEGTVLVKDIEPPLAWSPPGSMADVNGTLFFAADDNTHGVEVWKSNGTADGTVLVKDISAGSNGSSPNFLVNVNGTLFLSAMNGLWKSDGTEAATVRVKDPNTGGRNPIWLTALGNLVIFTATDNTAGTELWRSDGTEAGTFRLADIVPGGPSSNPSSLTAFGGKVYFSALAPSGSYRQQLWVTDGTVAGTQLLKDISPRLPNFISPWEPKALAVFNGALYCTCSDGTSGGELWKSDGTAAGTRLVRDIIPGVEGSYPADLTPSGSFLYFSARGSATGGYELWKTDGTSAGTKRVSTLHPSLGSGPSYLAPLQGNVAFMGYEPGFGSELWSSDGSTGGIRRLRDFVPGPMSGLISEPMIALEEDGTVIFAAAEDPTGAELWLSNGTAAGTYLLHDILPGPDSSNPAVFTRSGDFVYFRAMDRANGYQLWALRVSSLPDVGPPRLTCPAKTVVEATAPEGATVSYTVSASDNRTASPQVTYSHASGTLFPLGSTTVVVSGTDEASNTATCSFEVLVQDTTPPTLAACPGEITVEAPSSAGAKVTYSLPSATDLASPPVAVTASHASGSVFPLGLTTVLVTARDNVGNTRQCQFSVSVTKAAAPDGGIDPTPDGGVDPTPDGGIPDGGDGGSNPGNGDTDAQGGCGCTSSGGASLLAVLAGLVLLAQRRRQLRY